MIVEIRRRPLFRFYKTPGNIKCPCHHITIDHQLGIILVTFFHKDNFESYTLNSWSCAPKFRRHSCANVCKRMPHRKVNHHWCETLEKLFLIDLKTSIFVTFFHKYSFESYTLNMWSCASKFRRHLRSNVCNGKPYRPANTCWYENFPNHILNR